MGLKETLSLLITADASGATKAIEGVGHAADKSLGKTEDRIGAMGKKMTSVGAGMVATGGLLVAGFAAAAFASEDAEKSVLKLDNSIANNGKMAEGASQEFQDLAKSIQKKTAADADSIVSGQSVLVQMGLTSEQVKTLTPLAVDLAQKLGIDMDTAFKMVAKAANGSGGALKKAGIDIDETRFKTDAFGATVDALSTSVGGFAEKEGQTFAGTLARLKNELGDLEEAVGKGAAQGFQEMLNPVISLTGALTSLDPKLLETIGHFGAFGAVGITAAGGLLMAAGQMAKLAPLMSKTGEDGSKSMSGLGKSVAVIGIAMGVAALATEAWSQRAGTLTIDLKKMGDVTDAQLDKIIVFSSAVGAAAAGGMEQFGKQMAESSIPQALRYADAMDRAGVSSDEFRRGIDATKTSAAQAQISQEGHADAIDAEAAMLEEKAIPTLAEYQSGLKAAEDAQRGLTNSIKAATDPWFAALDAMKQNQEAADKAFNAQSALNTAVAAYGPNSDEAKEATRLLAEAQVASAASAGGITTAMHNLVTEVQNGGTSLASATTVLQGWAAQGLITQETAQGMIDMFANTAGAAAALDGTSITIAMKVEYHELQVALDLKNQLEGKYAPGATGRSAYGPPGNAAGTPSWRGGATWVGERGPELINLPSGTAIHSNRDSMAMAGGGNTYNYFTINAGMGTDGPAVGRQIIGLLEKATATGVRPGVKTLAAFRS